MRWPRRLSSSSVAGAKPASSTLTSMPCTTRKRGPSQAACDGPRFRVVQGMDVSVEEAGFAPATLEELKRRGHRIVTVDDYNQFGSCQAIWKLEGNAGGYFVASDPRRDGQAVGF